MFCAGVDIFHILGMARYGHHWPRRTAATVNVGGTFWIHVLSSFSWFMFPTHRIKVASVSKFSKSFRSFWCLQCSISRWRTRQLYLEAKMLYWQEKRTRYQTLLNIIKLCKVGTVNKNIQLWLIAKLPNAGAKTSVQRPESYTPTNSPVIRVADVGQLQQHVPCEFRVMTTVKVPTNICQKPKILKIRH